MWAVTAEVKPVCVCASLRHNFSVCCAGHSLWCCMVLKCLCTVLFTQCFVCSHSTLNSHLKLYKMCFSCVSTHFMCFESFHDASFSWYEIECTELVECGNCQYRIYAVFFYGILPLKAVIFQHVSDEYILRHKIQGTIMFHCDGLTSQPGCTTLCPVFPE